jgi:two-component system response regulator ChvI
MSELADALEQEGYKVRTYSNGRDALDAFNRDKPDLILTEVVLPKMDGLELLRRLRATSRVPIVILSHKAQDIDVILGLRMGADDYIEKSYNRTLLIERVRTMIRREQGLVGDVKTTDIINDGDLIIDPDRHYVEWKGHPIDLTITELNLLQALARRPESVKTRDQLLDIAKGEYCESDTRTVDCHIKRLRKKLRKVDAAFARIKTIYGAGYTYSAR